MPIQPTLGWEAVKGSTKAVADLLVRTFPDRFVTVPTGSSSVEGATAVARYSLRAKANAPVTIPIDWDDIARDVRFDHFNAKNVPRCSRRASAIPGVRSSTCGSRSPRR